MLLPVEISLVKISIHKDLVPQFLGMIPQFPYFQIRNYEEIKKSRYHLRKEKALLQQEQEFFNQRISEIEENLIYIFESLEVDPDEIEKPKPEKRLEITADSVHSLVDKLHEMTENQSRRLRGYFNDIDKYQEQLDFSVNFKAILKWLETFKIRKEVLDYFNQFTFKLFITQKEHLHDVEGFLDHEEISAVYQSLHLPNKKSVVFLIYLKIHEKDINNLVEELNAKEIKEEELKEHLTEDGVNYSKLDEDIEFAKGRIEKAKTNIKKVKDNILEFRAYLEILENIRNFVKLEQQFYEKARSQIVQLEAFIPTKDQEEISQKLIKKFGSDIQIQAIPISRNEESMNKEELKKEISPEDDDDEEEGKKKEISKQEIFKEIKVPSLVVPKKIFKPFKLLVDLYGTTNYEEIDPTPFVAFSFPLIFGLMFGDVGHGLVLLAFGIALAFMQRKNKESSMYDFGFLMMWLGIAAMFGGALYGEFFGHELIINGEHFVLFTNPLDNIVAVLKVTIIIGVVQISFGWLLDFSNKIIKGRVYEAFVDPFVKIVLLGCGTYLIFHWGFSIFQWISPPYPILLAVIPGIFLLIGKPLGKAVFHISYYQEESLSSIIGEVTVETGETYLNILSNVASYSRILALAMAHLGLMMIVTLLVEMMPDSEILIILVLIIGNLTVIIFEAFLASIHTLRLHLYEFFGKFYVGDGIRYTGTKILEDFSTIRFEKIRS